MLRDEGYRVVLVNSNPATIMTDPEFADATYVEPLDVQSLTRIIERERPDALLPTLGGQTALNLSIELFEAGVLDEYGVELIGASVDAIRTAENRHEFKAAMQEIGLAVPASGFAYTLDEAMEVAEQVGYPLIVRPSFILGGGGTGFAVDAEEMRAVAAHGLATSPVSEILIEQSIAGWKEYELEVMRDHADNVVVICSIENFDAMGVHTGDSITVAPAQTLTDVEYQRLRDDAFACIRRIGVDTGGSNIQFAVNPANGDVVVIEMNPRVSRSSALASKATGFPIAKIAARLAVGYRLDEIMNDITGETPASFEPTIDYVVTKVPRWAFEKLPGASPVLGTMMQSVGEVMAIGRTFPESLQKALRSLETGRWGLNCDPTEREYDAHSDDELVRMVARATPERPVPARCRPAARRVGRAPPRHDRHRPVVPRAPGLAVAAASVVERSRADRLDAARVAAREARWVLGRAARVPVGRSTSRRCSRRGTPPVCEVTYKTVDTCAAEFAARTPYHYGTYEDEDEVAPLTRPAVVILGSGPNRIGQGVEFDYCCVHAAFALSDAGFETVMLNCNPETVSTDYDTSDRLFFEPLFPEDVLAVCRRLQERATDGRRAGRCRGGTRWPDTAEAGPRRWSAPASPCSARAPTPSTSPKTASASTSSAAASASRSRPVAPRPPRSRRGHRRRPRLPGAGAPVVRARRPGHADRLRRREPRRGDGRARRRRQPRARGRALGGTPGAGRPFPRGRGRGRRRRHPRRHRRRRHRWRDGAHRGGRRALGRLRVRDPAADADARRWSHRIETQTHALADALDVRGLLNVQYAVKDDELFVIEANPRASRTVPFVSKATGVPLAKVASRVMVGATLDELRAEGLLRPPAEGGHIAVKEAVLPFNRFPDVDTVLGPEMRSTGEVMGIDRSFGHGVRQEPDRGRATASRARARSSSRSPTATRPPGLVAARRFAELGYSLVATAGHRRGARGRGLEGRRRGRQAHGRRRARGRTAGWTRSSCCSRGRSTWWSTRPGAGARGPTAPTSAAPPPPGASRASPRWPRPWPPRPGSSSGSRPRPPSAPCRSTTATVSSGSTYEPCATGASI